MALGRLITLDALGTLVELEPPAPRLVAELRRNGTIVSTAHAAAALREEIAYYRLHHDVAVDPASLARLRDRCAEVVRGGLVRAGADVLEVPHDVLRDALLAALRFRPFADVPLALAELRAAGHQLVVVSNWDVSLHDMLRETGLDALVDGAISSAEAGTRKPAPAIFHRALELAGADVAPGVRQPLHAGDSVALDVAGAQAAGFDALLVARGEEPAGVPPGVPVIRTLAKLASLAG